MLTRDDIEALASPPGPLPEDHAAVRERWPAWMKTDFRTMAPAAVWIGGARDLVSAAIFHDDGKITRFGGNRPCRPVKVGVSAAWRETVTKTLDQVPFWWQGLLVRLWVRSDHNAKILAAAITEHLAEMGEATELRRDFLDLGPDVALDRLSFDLIALADRLNMDSWDDAGLVTYLERQHVRKIAAAREAAQVKASRGRR